MAIDLIDQLAACLAGTDIAELELRGPGCRLVLTQPARDRPAAAPALTVTAASAGVFLHRHPLLERALAEPGRAVRAGQPLGLLRIGPLLLPVVAPRAGTVAGHWAAEGETVGYGTPLVELHLDTE